MATTDVQEKYKEYLNTRQGVRRYNRFKEIMYGTPDSLVVRLADYLYPRITKQKVRILDVGGGDGKRLMLLMSLLSAHGVESSATLVDQSKAFVDDLRATLENHMLPYDIRAVHSTFEEYTTEETFDIILLVHSYYTFKDATYVDTIRRMLTAGGLVVVVSDNENSFLAQLKAVTDTRFGTERKKITSVLEELRAVGFITQTEISLTHYGDCISEGALDEDGRLILAWIALGTYEALSQDTINTATELFKAHSKNSRISDEEIFVFAIKGK